MISSRTSLVFIVFAFASFALTANALCLRNVNGHIFNLCPLNNPYNVSWNVLPYWAGDLSFALAKANAPVCGNSTVNSWLWANSDKGCLNVTAEPVFSYIEQTTSLPGLKIDYILDSRENITVNLFCNQTATRDDNVNFFVTGVFGYATMEIYGYSYYGCPVKAEDNRFLSF